MSVAAWNGVFWLIFAAYWFVAAFRKAKTQRSEPALGRIAYMTLMVIGAILIFPELSSRPQPHSWIAVLRLTPLNHRFVPANSWIGGIGDVVTAAGVAFAMWARSHIGRYWSAHVRIAAGHKLIRSGPYARIRHPIYTGIVLALAGTVLLSREYRSLFGFALLVIGLVIKARKEESFLAAEFGQDFEEHRRATGFLFPRLSRAR